MLSPDLRAIFLQRHIAPPMQSIFDRPMGPHQLSYLASICLPGRETGDAVAHVLAGMPLAAHPALHCIASREILPKVFPRASFLGQSEDLTVPHVFPLAKIERMGPMREMG